MRQRGRKSADQLAINIRGAQTRLPTPHGLNAKERATFEQIVNSANPEHFRPHDTPLLVALAQATIQTHRLGRLAKKINDFDKSARLMMALATKLRLTPQARLDAKTVARMPPEGLSRKPWEMRETPPWDREDDDDAQKIQ